MNNTILRDYKRERKPTFHASYCGPRQYQTPAQIALHNAKTRYEFAQHECGEHDTPELGSVRLRIEVDDSGATFEDLTGDTYNEKVNPEIPKSRMDRERKQEMERIERDGVCGVIGEYFNGDKWIHVDSCWGFVGEDWKNSGYDIDIMSATLRKSEELRNVRDYKAPYPETWKDAIGELIPYNHGWAVIGYCCLTDNPLPANHFPLIFYVNIGPLYSQHCARCRRELIHGTSGVELFDGKRS